MWKYIRYSLLSVVALISTVSMFASGAWMWMGFGLAVVLAIGGDTLLGDDLSEPKYRHPWLLDLGLYLNLPILALMTFGFAWQIAPTDFLGTGALIGELTGIDLLARKAQNEWWHFLGGGLALGLLYGVSGTNVGHELTHRTWSKPAQITGRWLLAFTSDASFAIEHVYGHHKHVATRHDPATSRRGENAWAFVARSTVMSYLSAWNIEQERLTKQNRSVWSWHNRMIRGNLMTLSIASLFFAAAGPLGLLAFAAVSLYGKAWLEFINYVEHYGIVRVEGAPVEPRHSWNCNRRISGYLLYNLTRHSHHHAMGEKPFWQLRAYPDTPMMPLGYLGMIIAAMIPPLWNRVMIPRVLAWDAKFASPEERPLIEEANRLSGHPWFTKGLPKGIELPSITNDVGVTRETFESQEEEMISAEETPRSLAQVLEGIFGDSKGYAVHFAKSGQAQGSALDVPAGETILQAALNEGMAFPHNCRVGGCASCKCKLVQGQVKALTDASYVLSAQDINQGYILACQSIPRGDVTLEVPDFHPDERALVYKTGAVICGLEPLTHDIMRVRLRLDGPIAYQAGQYAQLSIRGQINTPRSYSFASAMPQGSELTREVEFHVRLVPNGQMSSWFHHDASIGDRLHLRGPFGDVSLRPDEQPLLFVAGGSGMAPLHALLQEAARQGRTSPITYLFGARQQQDLYFLNEIQTLKEAFPSQNLSFLPILSEDPANSSWDGQRGLVTDLIPSAIDTPLSQHRVYMCGPPGMIEAAKEMLQHEVPESQIHFDAFYDQSWVTSSAKAGSAA